MKIIWYNQYRKVGDSMIDRTGIVVYFQNKKAIKIVKKYDIHIIYVNEPGKYLVGYCNTKDFPTISKELKSKKLIRKVEESLTEMPSLDF